MKKIKFALYAFLALVCLSLLTPLIVDKNYLFPFILPRALFLRITLDLAFPFYVYLLLAKKEFRPNLKNPLNLSILAFLVIYFITSFTGVDRLRSVWGNIERMGGAWYMMHLVMLYFYILSIAQASSKLLLRFLKVFLWISIASVLYGVWVYIGLPGFYADPSLPSRVSSTFGNPIFFASFLILPLFLTIFFALQEENRGFKITYILAAILQLFGIYQSATRGAFVGLVAAAFAAGILYLFKAPNKKFRLYGFYGVGALIVLVGLLFALSGKVSQSSFLYRITHLKDNNSSARIIQWKSALQGFKDKPLLGVGPENYYVIANQHYIPEINKYDASWFDKPHNYLLEILVTTGAVGFVAYAAIMVFFVWGLYKAHKAELLSWLEFCLLACGMLAYQIQNFFVFDTISASVAFFAYLGFAGYLWYEADLTAKAAAKQKNPSGFNQAFLNAAMAVSFIVVIYTIYITSVSTGRLAKYINYGYAYASVDPEKSIEYFEAARSLPFIFDPGELGVRYVDFATILVQDPPKDMPKDKINTIVDNAIATMQEADARITNYPIYWYKLGQAHMLKSTLNSQPVSTQADIAAQKALDLAPKRPETILFMVQVRASENRMPEAIKLVDELQEMYPWNADYKWRSALLYHLAGQDDRAIQLIRQSLDQGYKISQSSDIQWLAQYYSDKKDYNAVIDLYLKVLQNNPSDVQALANLATTYAQIGDKQKAVETANKILAVKPDAKADVEKFIQGLQ